MSGIQARQPKGSPDGVQFAETAGAEGDVFLAAPPGGVELIQAALVKALAEATHKDPADVTVDLRGGSRDMTSRGWQLAKFSVDMGDPWGTKVHLSGWLTPAGDARELAIFAEYNQTQEGREETGCDTTSVVLTDFDGPISEAGAHVMQLASYQRGLEEHFNRPQRQALRARIAAGDFPVSHHEFLNFRATAAGKRPVVVVTDDRTSNHEELTIQLVNPGTTHTPIAIQSLTVQSAFGPVTTTSVASHHDLLTRLEQQFTGATEGTREGNSYSFKRRLYTALGEAR